MYAVLQVTAKNRHSVSPADGSQDHKTQQAQETQVKLGVAKVQRMEQPITHKVSKALTLDVFYHCDQLPNRPSALPVYIKIVVQSLL